MFSFAAARIGHMIGLVYLPIWLVDERACNMFA